MPSAKIMREAQQLARAETRPEIRGLKSERKAAKRLRNQQQRSSSSMAVALAASLKQAKKGIRGSGLTGRDAAIALAELSQRGVDTQAGAVLAQRAYDREYAETARGLSSEIGDVRASQGSLAAANAVDLKDAAAVRRDRRTDNKVAAERLRLDKRKQSHLESEDRKDRKATRADASYERSHGGRTPDEVRDDRAAKRTDVKENFEQALAKVRAGKLTVTTNQQNAEPGSTTGVQDTTPVTNTVTADHARERPGIAIKHIASELTNGNRDVARAVLEKWVGARPSTGTRRLMARYKYNFGFTPVATREAQHTTPR